MKFSQFQIEKKLFADAIGTAYSLNSDNDAGFVKILHQDLANHDEFIETFHLCAEKSCSIQNEFYIKALSHGQENGSHFIVYEKSSLVPLGQLISKTEILSVADAMNFVESVANILRNAHLDELIHAHISPEVIYSDANYKQTRIADFAFDEFISFLISKEKYQSLLDVLPYYSPEFILGEKPVRRQADIYSLGVIFYRLLVGEVPWLEQGMEDFFHKPEHRSVVPPSLKRLELPDYFDELILKSLEPDVENRCQSLSEFLKGMSEIKAEVMTRPTTSTEIPASAMRKKANAIAEKESETKEDQIENQVTKKQWEKQAEFKETNVTISQNRDTSFQNEQPEETNAVIPQKTNLKTLPPLQKQPVSVQEPDLSEKSIGNQEDHVDAPGETVREQPKSSEESLSEQGVSDDKNVLDQSTSFNDSDDEPDNLSDHQQQEVTPEEAPTNSSSSIDLEANLFKPPKEEETSEPTIDRFEKTDHTVHSLNEKNQKDLEKKESSKKEQEENKTDTVEVEMSKLWQQAQIENEESGLDDEVDFATKHLESEATSEEARERSEFGFIPPAEAETDSEDNQMSYQPLFDTPDIFDSEAKVEPESNSTADSENVKDELSPNSELDLDKQLGGEGLTEGANLEAKEKTKEGDGFDVKTTAPMMVSPSSTKPNSGVNPVESKPQFGPQNVPQANKTISKVPFTSQDEPINQFTFNNNKHSIRFYKKQVKGRSFINALRTSLLVLVPIVAIYLLIAITFDFNLLDRLKTVNQGITGVNDGSRSSNADKAATSPQDIATEPSKSGNRMASQTDIAAQNGQPANPSVTEPRGRNVQIGNAATVESLNLQLIIDDGQSPQVADVYINGTRYGTTNLQGMLTLSNLQPNRSYLLKVQKPGFEMWAREISFPTPSSRKLDISLKPLPAAAERPSKVLATGGQANITVLLSNPQNVSYAFVYVNGQLWEGGDNIAPAKLLLPVGNYEIEVKRDGYRAHPPVNSISLQNGDNKTIYFYLIPTN